MAKSKLFKKKDGKVPDELPDLAVDDLKKDLEEAVSGEPATTENNEQIEAPKENGDTLPEDQSVAAAEPEPAPAVEETPVEETPAEPAVEEVPAVEETPVEETPAEPTGSEEEIDSSLDPNKSFFNTLSKELDKDKVDIEKLNEWYKERFPKGDALEDMKDYWEDKKDELILESIGKEYKKKIKVSMQNLQKLEGEWQKIYFDLVTKEEEMKNQEKRLKETIREFTQIIKKRENQKKDKPEKKTNIKKAKKK